MKQAYHLKWKSQIGGNFFFRTAPAADGIFLSREGNTFVDPFPCLLRSSLDPRVRNLLDNGVRSVWQPAREPNMRILAAPNWFMPALSTNLNTPADAAAFEARQVDDDLNGGWASSPA